MKLRSHSKNKNLDQSRSQSRSQSQSQSQNQRQYLAVVSPRFNGIYFSVRYPDFNVRGEDIQSGKMNHVHVKSALKRELQTIIDEMILKGDPLPMADYVDDPLDLDSLVFTVTVTVNARS